MHNNQPDGRSNLTAEGHGISELMDKIESYIYIVHNHKHRQNSATDGRIAMFDLIEERILP
jgi:hypothetical protein